MNRGLLVMLIGLSAGLVAYQGWSHWRQGCVAGDLTCQLAWMREDLSLTDEQFDRVVALHARSSDRLHQLALEVSRMETEFAAFEQARKAEGRVDFLEFARFVAERRQIEAAADTSARSLIAATADVMSPQQRTRYLALVAPAAQTAPPGP